VDTQRKYRILYHIALQVLDRLLFHITIDMQPVDRGPHIPPYHLVSDEYISTLDSSVGVWTLLNPGVAWTLVLKEVNQSCEEIDFW
jgi:hypothetical protein